MRKNTRRLIRDIERKNRRKRIHTMELLYSFLTMKLQVRFSKGTNLVKLKRRSKTKISNGCLFILSQMHQILCCSSSMDVSLAKTCTMNGFTWLMTSELQAPMSILWRLIRDIMRKRCKSSILSIILRSDCTKVNPSKNLNITRMMKKAKI